MDNQFSDTSSVDISGLSDDPPTGLPQMNLSDTLPQRVPGETLAAESASAEPADSPDADPPNWVNGVSHSDASDYELLNRRIDDLQSQLGAMQAQSDAALQYLCQNMGWLVNMLSGVAQIAQNMPGMGGMMAKMLKGGK